MFNAFAEWAVQTVLHLNLQSKLGGAIHFFLYDSTKILALLMLMIFIISFIRSFFPPEKVRDWLEGKRQIAASLLAAAMGVLSPFCSCSTVPLFIGFVEAGIPIGITFTFLIASPIVNEVSMVMLFSIFGWKIALLYVGMGMLLAIVAGWIIGRARMEKYVESYVYEYAASREVNVVEESQGQKNRWKELFSLMELKSKLRFATDNVVGTVRKIWLYLFIGIGIGAIIHGYAPENMLVNLAGKGSFFSVPIATLIGVPLYSNAVGSIPIIEALLDKGVAVGTALSFMMAITALSFPELVLLRKVMKPKLIGVFVGVVTTGIIIIGYGFNLIL